MAGFTTHVTTSSLLGIGYGTVAHMQYHVPIEVSCLSAALCAVSGMLPDLDSDSGRPLRETIGFTASVVPMLLIHRLIMQGWTHDSIALAGIGVYAAVSWAQALRHRDAVAYAAIFHTAALRWAAVGFALLAFTGYGIGFWVPPYFLRERGISEGEAGLLLGGTAAAAGWLGVTLGGVWADRWHQTARGARCYVGIAAALLPLPFLIGMLRSESNAVAFVLNVAVGLGTSMWIGPGATTVQDLVPARLRGTASAAYLLVVTFIGLALGPYTIGRLSVALGDLRSAMLWALLVNPVAALCLWRASRSLDRQGRQA